ncbi:Methyltransf_21 domain-containing protein, partial [Durusdinium trenchii]
SETNSLPSRAVLPGGPLRSMSHDHHMHHGGGSEEMDPDAFCAGTGTVMMQGFQFAIGSSQPCAMFLFPGWVLDSAGTYVGGCFAAMLFPICIVGIQMVRELAASTEIAPSATLCFDLLNAVSYGFQMMFSYLAMLLVMLYETGIFFSLLLGFVISYFLLLRFKRTQKTQTREDPTAVQNAPCCSPS